jgi:hypothetical protein
MGTRDDSRQTLFLCRLAYKEVELPVETVDLLLFGRIVFYHFRQEICSALQP